MLIQATRTVGDGDGVHAAPHPVVYLIHFEQPYRHARHYTGWTQDLDARLKLHRAGAGARCCRSA